MEFNESTASFMTRMDRACRESFFTCRGITSSVIKNGNCIGHVLMLDIEDKMLSEVISTCDKRFSNYIILRSSEDSYHVINPVIRSFERTYELLKSISIEDSNHADIGYERGDWVLRITDKPNKPMPMPVFVDSNMVKHESFSRPHIKALTVIHDIPEVHLMNKLPLEGETLRTVKYWTFK